MNWKFFYLRRANYIDNLNALFDGGSSNIIKPINNAEIVLQDTKMDFDINFIHKKVNQLNNDKIIYLPNNEYIINDKVFIGYNGWWNYDNMNDLENAKSKY